MQSVETGNAIACLYRWRVGDDGLNELIDSRPAQKLAQVGADRARGGWWFSGLHLGFVAGLSGQVDAFPPNNIRSA